MKTHCIDVLVFTIGISFSCTSKYILFIKIAVMDVGMGLWDAQPKIWLILWVTDEFIRDSEVDAKILNDSNSNSEVIQTK